MPYIFTCENTGLAIDVIENVGYLHLQLPCIFTCENTGLVIDVAG
jgi:hypothetical protein